MLSLAFRQPLAALLQLRGYDADRALPIATPTSIPAYSTCRSSRRATASCTPMTMRLHGRQRRSFLTCPGPGSSATCRTGRCSGILIMALTKIKPTTPRSHHGFHLVGVHGPLFLVVPVIADVGRVAAHPVRPETGTLFHPGPSARGKRTASPSEVCQHLDQPPRPQALLRNGRPARGDPFSSVPGPCDCILILCVAARCRTARSSRSRDGHYHGDR